MKTGFPVENVDRGFGSLEGTHQALDLLAGGMMPEEVEETSQLEKQESLRLEAEAVNPAGLGPSPCLPDLVDFVTRTSGIQKDKVCSPLSESGDLPNCSSLDMGPLQPEILNTSIAEASVSQIDENGDNSLNLGTIPASRSPPREQIIGANEIPLEMPEQQGSVDVIQDYTKSSTCD